MNPENIEPHKWQPGQSGNPAGKPPGTLNSKTIIKRWLELEEKIKNPITQQDEQLSQMDIITLAQIAEARNGNTTAFNALLDRFEGKAMQPIDLNTKRKIKIKVSKSK